MSAIADALDRAYRDAHTAELAAGERMVILSDQHKGAGDGADDFLRCERSYNAALAYYDVLKYRLVLLGDVEELWENPVDEVLETYAHTLELEARFNRDGRYTRVFGNHDLVWKKWERFQERMRAHGVGDVVPREAVRLSVADSGGGELFLVHGHQGTADSDRNARLSQFLVRHGWRRLQTLLNRPWNTPAVDWALRGEHAAEMAAWAAANGRVMIAGHTHLPVFFKSRDTEEIQPEPPAGGSDADEALRAARREWADAERRRLEKQRPPTLETPCYFNTGCCSFGDGDITGIELIGGRIRLVRWPCESEVAPHELAAMDLAEVFELTGG
jgi:predicted phosphodiesterase